MKYIFGNNPLLTIDFIKSLDIKETDTIISCNPYNYGFGYKIFKWICSNIKAKEKICFIRNFTTQLNNTKDKTKLINDIKMLNFNKICFVLDNFHDLTIQDASLISNEIRVEMSRNRHYIGNLYPSTGYVAADIYKEAVCVGFQADDNHSGNIFHGFDWEHQQLESRIIKIPEL